MLTAEYRAGHRGGQDQDDRPGKIRRTCGECYPYKPGPPRHRRGGITYHTAGQYPHRRRGSTVGVDYYGQDVLCSFPDCLNLFVSTRGDEEYCPAHAGKREQARRLRRRLPEKHLCFEFTVAPPFNQLQYHWGPIAQEVIVVAGEAHRARDEAELAELASFTAREMLIAKRVA